MTSSPANESSGGDPAVLRIVKRKKNRRGPWIAFVLLSLGATGAGAAVWKSRASAAPTTQYQTQKIERGDLRVSVTATGTLKARSTVEVGAEITGRVLQVHVNFNDKVTKGQILAEIDTETYEARVEEAKAQLTAASASLQNAKATENEAKLKLDRGKPMVTQGVLSQQDFEGLEANYARSKSQVVSSGAQVTLARASLKVAQTNLSKAVIRSPQAPQTVVKVAHMLRFFPHELAGVNARTQWSMQGLAGHSADLPRVLHGVVVDIPLDADGSAGAGRRFC